MFSELIRFWDFHMWTVIAVGAAVLAVISIIADRQRYRRAVLENVGFVPWTGISITATLVTFLATALAIKAG
jgi:hypothetical protein